jgi:tetratricopeptide (TPR) repeat protein
MSIAIKIKRGALAFVAVAAAGVASMAATGCGSEPRVVRVYDGRVVQGRYVSPEAYAAFLRGALAEEAGDLKAAAVAYGQAADEDDEDPEIFARLGEVRCKLDPKDGNADRAFGRAVTLDASYAGALAAWSRCASARGKSTEALDLARRAVSEDPKNVELQALLVRSAARHAGDPTTQSTQSAQADMAAREQAVALTLAHGESAAAWDALAAWGRSHRDAELVARALEGLVHAAPMRSLEVEEGAVALLEGRELALARRVASVLVDAPREMEVLGPRGHVALAEVAARALVQGQREIATAVATQVTEADPGASGAAMVKASLQGVTSGFAHVTDQPPELCALVFADRLATAVGTDVARQWLARITRTPMSGRDPVAGPLAVDLAARGVLPVTDLPPELRLSAQHARAAN